MNLKFPIKNCPICKCETTPTWSQHTLDKQCKNNCGFKSFANLNNDKQYIIEFIYKNVYFDVNTIDNIVITYPKIYNLKCDFVIDSLFNDLSKLDTIINFQ